MFFNSRMLPFFFVKAGNFQKFIFPCSVIKAQGLQIFKFTHGFKTCHRRPREVFREVWGKLPDFCLSAQLLLVVKFDDFNCH